MSNHLPIRVTRNEETGAWEFAWDEDALIAQAQARRPPGAGAGPPAASAGARVPLRAAAAARRACGAG